MTLNQILKKYDNPNLKRFEESEILTDLIALICTQKDSLDNSLIAEYLAFIMFEDYSRKNQHWGTYLAPDKYYNRFIGDIINISSIAIITTEILNYWEKRAVDSKNPILVARYTGLIYIFKEKLTFQKTSFAFKVKYVNSLLDVVNGQFNKQEQSKKTKITRAFTLALSFKNNDLINKCTEAILQFEENTIYEWERWNLAFDLLIEKNKIVLLQDDEAAIITGLERKLRDLTLENIKPPLRAPDTAYETVERLVNYYERTNREGEKLRVIIEGEKAYNNVLKYMEPVHQYKTLEKLYEFFNNYKLKQKADETLVRIKEFGLLLKPEFKKNITLTEIDQEIWNDCINYLTSGDIKEILNRISNWDILNLKVIKSKSNNLSHLFTNTIFDGTGRKIATSQGQDFKSLFLLLNADILFIALSKLVSQNLLNTEDIINFISDAAVIKSGRLTFFEKGLRAFFSNDFIVSMHILIPQIEEAVRNYLEISGENILRPKNGANDLLLFDKLLREPAIEAIENDFAVCFRTIFTDTINLNLRNKIMHGLAEHNLFNPQNAALVIYAVLCLKRLK